MKFPFRMERVCSSWISVYLSHPLNVRQQFEMSERVDGVVFAK